MGTSRSGKQALQHAETEAAERLAGHAGEAEGGEVRVTVGAVDEAAGDARARVLLQELHQGLDGIGRRERVGVQDVEELRRLGLEQRRAQRHVVAGAEAAVVPALHHAHVGPARLGHSAR
jgi:hypothetical protein